MNGFCFINIFQIFRHGERTPDKKELYQKSEYYNKSAFHPYGHGQLTNVSCYKMFLLIVNLKIFFFLYLG